MFKLKVSVLLFFLSLLSILVAVYAIDEGESDMVQRYVGHVKPTDAGRQVGGDVERSRYQLQRNLRLHELELRNVAQALADGELRVAMETLHRYRDDMSAIEREVYAEVTLQEYALDDPEGMRRRQAFVRTKSAFLDAFTNDLADSYSGVVGPSAWERRDRGTFIRENRKMLVQCVARSVADCRFRFTHYPLGRDTERLRRRWADRVDIDLAIVSDRSGTGLADAFDATWSSDGTLGDSYPIVRATSGGRTLRDVVFFKRTNSYYIVVATPIHGEEDNDWLGTVLVGTQLDEGYVHGLEAVLGLDVTLFHDNELIVSTTSEGTVREHIMHSCDLTRTTPQSVRSDGFAAASVPYLGNYSDNRVHAVVSVNLDRAQSSYGTLKIIVTLFGLAAFLIALIVIHVFIGSYARQFEGIDAGIHEIINGNHDYQFSFDMPDPLASGMAQSLNLMTAVLLGRPLPEEENGAGWEEALLIAIDGDEEDELDVEGDSDLGEGIATVAPTAPPGEERGQELLTEPAEAYYRRLYAEFVEARRTTGESTENITYLKFVEKLVRQEHKLRDRLGVRFVRFDVSVRNNQVMLTPIPIP